MDYSELSIALLGHMLELHTAGVQKHIVDALQGEAFVLQFLARHGGHVLPGEISNKMNVSSARIAQTLNNIEKKGLITRQIDPDDRRKILVALTPEGEAFAEQYQQMILDVMSKILIRLGDHDAAEYVRIVGKLATVVFDC